MIPDSLSVRGLVVPVDSVLEFSVISRVSGAVFTLSCCVQRPDGSFSFGSVSHTVSDADTPEASQLQIPSGFLIFLRASTSSALAFSGDGYCWVTLIVGPGGAGPQPARLLQGLVDVHRNLSWPGLSSAPVSLDRLEVRGRSLPDPGAGVGLSFTLTGWGYFRLQSCTFTLDNSIGTNTVDLHLLFVISPGVSLFVPYPGTIGPGQITSISFVRGLGESVTGVDRVSVPLGEVSLPPGSNLFIHVSGGDGNESLTGISLSGFEYRLV